MLISIYFCYNRYMEKDVLSEVIQVEKEIQKCLEIEKVKVHDWLETAKKEAEKDFVREGEKIQESLEKSLEEAARAAEAKAAGTADRAAAAAERLGQLKTETLSGIVRQKIGRILPGSGL